MAIVWDVLGAIGAASGVPALGWQVYTWRRSGPVVKVSVYDSPASRPDEDFVLQVAPDVTRMLVVTARNFGRSDACLVGWGFWLGNNQYPDRERAMWPHEFPLSSKVPFDLLPNRAAHFYYPKTSIAERMSKMGYTTARGYVGLATGEVLKAPADT